MTMRVLHWRTGLFWLIIFVVVLIMGGGLFAASGLYNVAASKPHLGITTALIEFALRRSVATHSLGVTAPNLGDEGLVRLGASHFALGCAPCHGSPLGSNDPIVGEMYPEPPPLAEAVESWDTEELFWIVRHGFKFTGMPGWSGEGRDDEVWALVAFLEELPGMDEKKFG
jgi:mono/diheme cytochrome c family protein